MSRYKLTQNNVGFIGAICGSLLIVLTVPFVAVAQSGLNSKPDPTTFPGVTQIAQPAVSTPVLPPLPETQQPPSASVTPINSRLTVRLVNRTGAAMSYQVVGDTQERTLPGQTNITLQALKIPATITFYRQDRGLLQVRPQASPGLLSVTFTETTDLGADKNVLMIQEPGSVFLN